MLIFAFKHDLFDYSHYISAFAVDNDVNPSNSGSSSEPEFIDARPPSGSPILYEPPRVDASDFLAVELNWAQVYPQRTCDGYYTCFLLGGENISLCERLSFPGYLREYVISQDDILSTDLVEISVKMDSLEEFTIENFTDKQVELKYLFKTVHRDITIEVWLPYLTTHLTA